MGYIVKANALFVKLMFSYHHFNFFDDKIASNFNKIKNFFFYFFFQDRFVINKIQVNKKNGNLTKSFSNTLIHKFFIKNISKSLTRVKLFQ